MELKCVPYGPLASNMYFLNTSSGCFIIDPSVDPDRLSKENIPEEVDAILVTHAHFDHINAVDKWHELFPEAPVYVSSKDSDAFSNPTANGSMFFAEKCTYKAKVSDIAEFKLDNLKVIETPGHSKGSVCLLFEEGEEKVMFTGDTLFAGSAGRTDLWGGSGKELKESFEILRRLDPDIMVFPGHGPSSTIGEELVTNPFF